MRIRFALCGAVVLALAGCGGTPSASQTSDQPASSTSTAATSTTPATSSTSAAAATQAAPAKGAQPTREFLVGKWGTDGDCTLAIDLRPDGTSDGPFGNWSYSGGTISFADAPELKVNVTVIDDNTMESRGDGGKTAKMTRCP
jgi:hypothetical protein